MFSDKYTNMISRQMKVLVCTQQNSSLFIALVSKDSVIIFNTPFSRNTHAGRGVKVGSHELYHDLMNWTGKYLSFVHSNFPIASFIKYWLPYGMLRWIVWQLEWNRYIWWPSCTQALNFISVLGLVYEVSCKLVPPLRAAPPLPPLLLPWSKQDHPQR